MDEVPNFPRFLNEEERMVHWTFWEAVIFVLPVLLIGLFGLELFGLCSIPLGLVVGYLGFYIVSTV